MEPRTTVEHYLNEIAENGHSGGGAEPFVVTYTIGSDEAGVIEHDKTYTEIAAAITSGRDVKDNLVIGESAPSEIAGVLGPINMIPLFNGPAESPNVSYGPYVTFAAYGAFWGTGGSILFINHFERNTGINDLAMIVPIPFNM